MSTVKGLGGAYSAVKKEFALTNSLFSILDTEGVETRYMTYNNTLKAVGNNVDNTYASSASRGADSAPPSTPPPATGGGALIFPLVKPPLGHNITSLVEKAVSECPLCHIKHHGLAKCGYALRAGLVCQHKPDKATKQLTALNLGHHLSKPAAGNRPSASLARAPSALPPPAPS